MAETDDRNWRIVHTSASLDVVAGVAEPGNGSRYAYIIWRAHGQWYAAFPDYHAASPIGAGHNFADYIREKMRCSSPDAEQMADIINAAQRAAGGD